MKGDVEPGYACSRLAYNWAQKTFANREGKFGAPYLASGRTYCGIFDIAPHRLAMTSDGIGTKIEVAERLERYDTLGYDLMAMIVDDLAANGAQPLTISNILDVDNLEQTIVDDLMRGLTSAATQAQVTISGGEIAELGARISGYGLRMHFNWCGTGLGFFTEGQLPLEGSAIQEQDVILALAEPGLRANGFTPARQLLLQNLGQSWHEKICPTEERCWGEVLLTPSTIYAPLIVELLRSGCELHQAVHVTGGGIVDNLSRVLQRRRLGAKLDNLFAPPAFVRQLQEFGQVSDEQAYRRWNMGQGMLLIVSQEAVPEIIAIAKRSKYLAKVAGVVVADSTIKIRSMTRPALWLSFDALGERK